MQSFTVKRGDTLTPPISITIVDGDPELPVSLTALGGTWRSQARRRTVLVAELTVDIADQTSNPGVLLISAAAGQTKDWPIGPLNCDVQFTSPTGVVLSTDTFQIVVLEDVTQDIIP